MASDFLKLQRKSLEKTNRPGVPLPLELQQQALGFGQGHC